MTTSARPKWVRLDIDIFDNPKFLQLQDEGNHRAAFAWIQLLMYSTRHLTDGWIPKEAPRRLGCSPKDLAALEAVELVHRMDIDPRGGWLIHDYTSYQPPKEYWIEVAEKKRKAARARWDRND